jgi:hypothetical protein
MVFLWLNFGNNSCLKLEKSDHTQRSKLSNIQYSNQA